MKNLLERANLSYEKLYVLTNQNSEELNAFCLLNGNRKINHKKIEKLVKAFESGEFIPNIIVSSTTREIIEGNHRYLAARECINRGIPFRLLAYVYEDPKALATARQINNTQTKWNDFDKLHSFCVEGKEDYIRLRNFIDAYGGKLKICQALNVLVGNRKLGSLRSTFSKGTLVVSDEHVEFGQRVMSKLIIISKYIGDDAFNANCIAVFVSRYFSFFEQDSARFVKFLKKLKSHVKKGWVCPDKRGGWQNIFMELTNNIK